MNYLITANGRGTLMDIPRGTSSEDWGILLRAYAEQAKEPSEFVADAISLWPENVAPGGVTYDWELAGPGGASYRLHIWTDTTKEAEQQAVNYVKRSFDVVRLIKLRLMTMAFEVPKRSASN